MPAESHQARPAITGCNCHEMLERRFRIAALHS
jgi:hypothetical protein